jgi:hypothetical protein
MRGGLQYFKVRVKLAHRFIDLFKIMEEREERMKVEFLIFFFDLSKS